MLSQTFWIETQTFKMVRIISTDGVETSYMRFHINQKYLTIDQKKIIIFKVGCII